MANDDDNKAGDSANQPHPDSEKRPQTSQSEAEHEVIPHHSDSESDTNSTHHDEQDEKSTHHSVNDNESEHHHDPQPEGSEGLNVGPGGVLAASELGYTSRVQSRASSTRSRPLVVVPRGKRRGLFAGLTLVPEVERPYDYSRKTKWIITTVVALAAAGGPLGSNIMYPALADISKDLHTSETIVNMTVAFYMLAMSIFPLWWSSFSETLGRRTIYIVSFSLFVVFSVLSALSKNIGMLIAMRILGGGASASVQAVGAGTIADLWEIYERGQAMNTFYLGPLLGPLFAPIIGGALAQGLGWRSTMWFLAIFGGINLLSLLFFLPETLARPKPPAAPQEPSGPNSLTRSSTRQSVARKTARSATALRKFLIDPLHCITYLRNPPVAIVVALASITFAALFILSISLQATFAAPPYQFSTIIIGLLYIPSSLGYFIASLFGGRWVDYIMAREAKRAGRFDARGKLIFHPEDRLKENAWIAVSMYPLALIWYGWCADKGVFWFAAVLPNFFFGVAAMLVFGAVTTMLTEFMPRRSSSGVALNNFVRNIFSCVGVIITEPLLGAMGVGWLCTMVALLCLVVANGSLWVLARNSARWRKEMDERMKGM